MIFINWAAIWFMSTEAKQPVRQIEPGKTSNTAGSTATVKVVARAENEEIAYTGAGLKLFQNESRKP